MKGLIVKFVIALFFLSNFVKAKREGRIRHSGKTALSDEAEDEAAEFGQCQLEITCKGKTTSSRSPVKLPIRGPRGPMGRPGEKGPPGKPGKQGPQGVPGKSADPVTQKHVAFFVGLGSNMGPIDNDIDLKFDRIVTNVGMAYDIETGKFTAPFPGTYQFTVVVAAQGRRKAAVRLVKNREMIVTVWAESIPYWATSSNTAILNLTSGDQVWLVLQKHTPYLHGYSYTSFSGYSLFANTDEDATLIATKENEHRDNSIPEITTTENPSDNV